ncbi:Pre-mRNA-splicing factor SYF1 [Hondaea fermentalgiana]|uniref:Pre-mRNA-splicing factor SYF1 n=1 Tax=Hondaea fermentalgiana TaxID=2315210 RepID=A0A2R5GNE8_9STRA|nr:Pre-mRNA-splicing factor SYF1 [Hondaea fermentalgiana]|eukprot:GBG31829.1 Pre-mRNA-splicing factor SYF1 [Hondaea fermentalgiana]
MESAIEEKLVREPHVVKRWIEYLDVKKDAPYLLRVAIYERALFHLPGSYKLWFRYLDERCKHVRGKPLAEKEYELTNAAFDRALVYMNKMPRIWIMYAAFLRSQDLISRCRLALDDALRALPITQHNLIWDEYLRFVYKHNELWQLGCHVWPKYLQFEPRHREKYVDYLLEANRHGEAMEQIGIMVSDPGFVSAEGRTLHDIWIQLCDLIVKYPAKAANLGRNKLDVEAVLRAGLRRFSDETGRLWCALAEFHIKLGQFGSAEDVYEEGMRAVNTVRDFSTIFDAYVQYQEAMLTAKMDLFGDDEEEDGDEARDNNTDSGTGSSAIEGGTENDKAAAETAIEGPEAKRRRTTAITEPFYHINADSEDKVNDVDLRLAQLSFIIDQRPFLLNEVVLRQNPHNVQEWLNRAKLFREKEDVAQVVTTLNRALEVVNPALALGRPSELWIQLSKVYEDNEDSEEARKVLQTAADSPFRDVEDLVAVVCASIELELRHEAFERALTLARDAVKRPSERAIAENIALQRQRRTKGVEGPSVPGADDVKNTEGIVKEKFRLQQRLYKSTRLWSLYADLEESLGTLATARAAYESMIDLKVATPQTILNLACLLYENNFYEDAFKALEKGVALFDWPHVGDIWSAYLTKFVSRYGGSKMERTRELFEKALAGAPADKAKPLFLLLSDFEEEHGDSTHAMANYERLCATVPENQKVDMYNLAAAKAHELVGVSRMRNIFESALEDLQDPVNLREVSLRFAEKERALGEIDRARAIFKHAAQFANPRTVLSFWDRWKEFEVEHGNEDTYKEMLRVKRSIQVRFQDTNYALGQNDSHDSEKPFASQQVTNSGNKKDPNDKDKVEDGTPAP